MNAKIVLVAFSLLVCGATPIMAAPSADELRKIEEQVIRERQEIKFGTVKVTLRCTASVRHPNLLLRTKTYKLFFNGDRARADADCQEGDKSYSLQHFVTDKLFVRSTDPTMPVQFYREKRDKRPLEIPDPRLLGLVAWSVDSINQFGMDTHLLRKERTDLEVEDSTLNDLKVWKVKYKNKYANGFGRSELCLSPACGNLPSLAFHEYHSAESSVKQEIEVKNERIDNKWFPSQVNYRYWSNGVLDHEEVATVELADFKTPPKDEVFTVKGLGLEVGRLIDTIDNRLVWDGEKMIDGRTGATVVE